MYFTFIFHDVVSGHSHLNVFFINLPLQVAQMRGSRCKSPSRCLRTAVRLTVSAAHRARHVQAAVTHRAAGPSPAHIAIMLRRRMEEYVIKKHSLRTQCLIIFTI